jgi:hypothetical protein
MNIINYMSEIKNTIVVRDSTDIIIDAVKSSENPNGLSKTRLYLDVDGTLVAMEFDPNYMSSPDGA